MDEFKNGNRLMTSKEVQDLMRASRSKIFRMVRDNSFPAPIKAGPGLLWHRHEVEEYLNSCPRVVYKYRSEIKKKGSPC